MHTQETASISGDKEYFYGMISSVRKKLDGLPGNSLIKKYFPLSRVDEVKRKIDFAANMSDLKYWLPFFTFLSLESRKSLKALDEDLRVVVGHQNQ